MESVFEQSTEDGGSYLHNLMHAFGCSYICLWAYDPHLNCLYSKAGYYHEEAASRWPSSSAGSLVRRLFDDYKESMIFIMQSDQQCVPGLAFKQRNHYLEQHESDLQRLAITESQRQFYQEARIKIAVFMGCDKGEIELGMSYLPQMEMKMKMISLFPQDFAREQNWPTSSPSFSSMSNTSVSFLQEQIESTSITIAGPSNCTNTQTLLTPAALNQLQNILNIPDPESTDAALTRAYLVVLSSSSTSVVQPNNVQEIRQRRSAFRRYDKHANTEGMRSGLRRQTMLKRAILYSRRLDYHKNRPMTSINQLQHMISERMRREKLNESFRALRSILPPGTKKNQLTVLRTAIEHLSRLKAQVESQTIINVHPEEVVFPRLEAICIQHADNASPGDYNEERPSVWITPVSGESTSRGERMVDLQVRLRGHFSSSDSIIRVLEFLRQVREASLVSMEAQVHHQQPNPEAADQNPTHLVNFRLRIEGIEWDESAFKEAVRRMIADLAQSQPANLKRENIYLK